MIKIGMIIGDRYEILEKIGTGGMSDVYKAKCHKLNRFVAVKVLKQEFSENANFVSKFRIEAQAAAGLMHPNIVNVYDVGEENGIYYIVMELVDGITLKKYIEKKARLFYKEAVSIAIQVSMGIEAAHKNHIIHRDIKPQNIIISKDGKVKVTDFGIAKAATSNTITSNVMGSVHYTSPEQARGGYSDEKSDIYSLGITLFEMLTGRVPFNGETTVAIAIKHIQEEMPSPKEYVPEIPASVEGIVLKCCHKSPDRRYQSIAELIGDLKQSLINPDEDFVVRGGPDAEGSTRMISDNDIAQIKRQSGPREHVERTAPEPMRLRRDVEPVYEDEEDIEEDEEEYEEGDDYDYDPKMEKVTTILAIVAGLIICGIVIFLLVRVFGAFGSGEKDPGSPIITTTEETTTGTGASSEAAKVEMPEVAGKNVEEVKGALTRLGLDPQVEYEESDTYEEGIVIEADIRAGAQVDVGTKVNLTVSSGVQGVEVPDVTGKLFEEANTSLISQGFLVNRAENYSDTIEKDRIITQNPTGGNKAPRGSVVTVTVSLGAQENKIKVPNVMGLSEEDGTFELLEAGLVISSVSQVYHSEYPEGSICYQSYSHGSYVDQGTTIEIRVSLGPEQSQATYKYNGSIGAPTAEEAPDYVAGTEVGIVLVTDDGVELLNMKTSSFPVSPNYYNLTSPGGTITFTYTVTTQASTSTDPVTGEVVTIPGGTETKSFTRKAEFTKE